MKGRAKPVNMRFLVCGGDRPRRDSLEGLWGLILEDRREDALRRVPDDVERETVTLE